MTSLKVVFPDTNTFLHYLSTEQIDWPRELNCDRVILLITQIVIHQLNEKKDSPGNSRLRQRAGAALKRMYSYSEETPPVIIRNAVELQFQPTEPQIDFAAKKLNQAISDDWLLASILEFKSDSHEGEVVLVTGDLGLRIKARSLGIPTHKLSDEYKLPEDEDPNLKRIRELEEENRRLQSRIPHLKLGFKDGGSLFRAKIARSLNPEFSPEMIESRMLDLRCRYPKLDVQQESMNQLFAAKPIQRTEFELYNCRIEQFWIDFRKYLENCAERLDWLRRLIKLELQLFNEGTCPATDIDLFVHFPEGVDIYEDGRLPGPSEKPSPPLPPGSLDLTNHMINWNLVSAFPKEVEQQLTLKQTDTYRTIYSNVSPLMISKTKNYDVRAKVRELKHHFRESVCELYISFPSWDSVKPFGLPYSLLASNIPHKVEDSVHIIVEVETQ